MMLFSTTLWMECLYFICFVYIAASNGCPVNWLSHDESCYALIDTPLIWTAASQTCRTLGSELVTVNDVSEHTFLNNTLRPLHTKEVSSSTVFVGPVWKPLCWFSHEAAHISCYSSAASGTLVSYWTSGNDLVKEGHWVWANNAEMSYNGWAPGEPNNARGANCLALHSIELFHFNDDFCNTSLNRFICEMPNEDVDTIVVG